MPPAARVAPSAATAAVASAAATAAVAALGATLAAGGNALVDLRVRRATLEDVYLGLTRGEEAAA